MIKNYFSLIFSQIIGRLISFFWVIYLARAIGVENYGLYGAIMAVVSIGANFIDLGIHFIVVRDAIKKPELMPNLMGSQMWMRGILSLLVTVAILVGTALSKYSGDVHVLFFLACLHMFFHNMGMIGETIFSALKKQRLIAAVNLMHTVGWAVLGFLVLQKYNSLPALFVVMALNSLIFLVVNYTIVFSHYVKPNLKFNGALMKELLILGFPIGLTGIFAILFQRLDRILMVWLRGAYEAGIYNAVATLLAPIGDFVWSQAIIILYPYMIHLYEQQEKFEFAFRNILLWLVAGMLAFTVPCVMFPGTIVKLLFGAKYIESSGLLPLLAISLLAIPFHGFFGRLLMVQNKQKEYAYAFISVAVINTVMNLLLIKKLGAMGPCISAVATNFVLIGFYSFYSGESLGRFIKLKQLIVLVAAAFGLGFAAKLTETFNVYVPFFVFAALFAPAAFYILDFKNQWLKTREILN